jgi:hypothetical protein
MLAEDAFIELEEALGPENVFCDARKQPANEAE